MSAAWTERFHRLGTLLAGHDRLWRPAPFHVPRPAWCAAQPALAAHLLGLPDETVTALADNDDALVELLARFVPALAELPALLALPHTAALGIAFPDRLLAHVPGRKRAQIEAFTAAVGEVRHPLVEWCAGKGALGRAVAHHSGQPVVSLENDATLVDAGITLAHRAGVDQAFVRGDALAAASATHLAGRHAVALHACGDLHLALLRGAVAQRTPALDLAPCCYYRIATPAYRPLTADAALRLSRDELHLAVTDTATAGARDRRRRDTAMAWKLAFLELRAQRSGTVREVPFPPVPAGWLAAGFSGWTRRLAMREGIALDPEPDWQALERMGWQRQRETVRLDLARLAFRRALELWLVLDRALFLGRAGYDIRLTEFCPRTVTPRNLLISARA